MKENNVKKDNGIEDRIANVAEYIAKAGKNLSAKELLKLIAELSIAHEVAVKREAQEKKVALQQEIREKERAEKEAADKRIREATSMDLPLDYENVFNGDARTKEVRAESIADGLILSLTNLGKVDIEYIASVTGEPHKKIIESLKGSIYQNPLKWDECFYKGWETADEYLSGNLVRKFTDAKRANNKYKGYFNDNVKAIERIIPKSISSEDIFVTLGSPWVPADMIDDFIEHLLGRSYCSGKDFGKVKHDELTGTWEIPHKTRYSSNPRAYSTFGTKKITALYIIEKTLNMQNVAVFKKIPCPTNKSGEKSVIDKSETTMALSKQQEIIKHFRNWIWQDERRKERLIQFFEERYSCYKKRRFDGGFLQFPTMDKSVRLYPYQKDAVARILFSGNTLLAHDVGSGKTYIMIAAGMELRRMGLSRKNLYVVPNNIVGQWEKIYLSMYPSAKLKIVEPKTFTVRKREQVLKDIMQNDYDGIIMAYSCFEQIPLSNEYYREKLEEEKSIIAEYENNDKKNTSGIRRAKNKVIKELQELISKSIKTGCITSFDELGITRLFVDEAHNFKNVPIETKIDRVLGISATGSKKCKDMLDKVRFVQRGGGVVMATGTPITNSVTDAFVMQTYLQSGELALLDLQSFDAWIGMFAERKSEFEIDVDTNSYRLATRFSKFHNLPELTTILASVADFHTTKQSEELPVLRGYSDCLISKSRDFNQFLQEISYRADAVRRGLVKRTEDNLLLITTDGRKAALDLRLIDDKKPLCLESKVYRCAENVYDIYAKTAGKKLTQLVFCDTSTPKSGFNLYDELKNILTSFGVNYDEIAYINDATTEKKRNSLFRKMQRGDIRILIGSTFKLGLGVNVQDKLVALHHLDVPWRPADMVQREGRILRPGNDNKEIFIYRYITEGSFDAYSWQLLETKQNFISALLSGSLEDRESSDIQDVVLNYAEVKAIAIGNPLIKERVEVANELARLRQLHVKTVEMREGLMREVAAIPKEIEEQKVRIENCESDMDFYKAEKERLIAERETENEGKDEKTVKAEKTQKKNRFNDAVYGEVIKNVLKTDERHLTDYCGFKVILPANMFIEKPFVYLERSGRYYVELGESSKGVMVRLYNCLEGLDERLERLRDRLNEIRTREKAIKEELAKDTDYSDRISETLDRLKNLDEKLGVKYE